MVSGVKESIDYFVFYKFNSRSSVPLLNPLRTLQVSRLSISCAIFSEPGDSVTQEIMAGEMELSVVSLGLLEIYSV